MEITNLFSIFFRTLNIKLAKTMKVVPKGPLVIYLALTNKCNLKCKICNIGRDNKIKDKREMSKEEIIHLITEASKMGVKVMALWGGEPLLNRDLGEIVEKIHKLKMSSYLVTNGYLLNEQRVSELVKCKINSVSVSIDHTEADKHDEIRGIKGAFEKIYKGIKMLKEKGGDEVKVGINMVINKENYNEIFKMLELALSLKIDWVKFLPVHFGFPYNNKEFGDGDLMPTKDQIEKIHRNLKEVQKAVRKNGLYTNSDVYLDSFREFFNGKYLLKDCISGYLSCDIDSYGNVTQCSLDSRVGGNVLENSFYDIWNSEKFDLIRKDHNQKLCGHCWVSCYAESSLRTSFKYSLRNIQRLFKELSFLRS